MQDSGASEGAGGAENVEAALNEKMSSLVGRFTDGNITTDDWGAAWTQVGLPVVKAIILIIVILLVAGWAKKLVTAAASKARVEITLSKFFGNMARWAVLILGAIAILQTFGVNTTSFAAVVAAMGFAVGMAMSGTLGNFSSGVMLLIFRPFKVGDVVNIGGTIGKVDEIELFSTTLDTADLRRIIVPNGSIFGATIENITHHSKRRVDVAVGTEYSADLDEVRRVLTEAATAVEGRLPDEPPVVYLLELGASSIDWSVRVWAPTGDYWAVRERLTHDVKVALDKAGIGIPFPQRDVNVPGPIEVKVTRES